MSMKNCIMIINDIPSIPNMLQVRYRFLLESVQSGSSEVVEGY